MPRRGGQSGRNIKCCHHDPRCPGQGDRPAKGFWLAMIVRADVKAFPVAEWLGADCDRAGRVKVEGDLSVPGHPNIFVIGDAAVATGPDGKPLPGVAPVAMVCSKSAGGACTGKNPASIPLSRFWVHGHDRSQAGGRTDRAANP